METWKQSEQHESIIEFEHTPESYRDVLFWSFLLSQGNPQIQKIVLDYVVSQVGPFRNEEYKQSLELFTERYFDGDALELSPQIRNFHKPIEGKAETIEREYDLYRRFDTSTPLKTLKYQLSFLDHPPTVEVARPDMKAFSNLLWRTDGEYLATKYGWEKPKGRPNRDESNDGTGSLKDRWFSFGVHYLIKKNGAPNVPVIDQLLIEARVENPLSERDDGKLKRLKLNKLNDIIEQYNLTHPSNMTTMNEINDYFSNFKDERVEKE